VVGKPLRLRLSLRLFGPVPTYQRVASTHFSQTQPRTPGSRRIHRLSIRGFLDDAGRDPDGLDPAMYLDVVIGDEDAAVTEAQEFYDRYYPSWDRLSPEEVHARGAFGPASEVAATLEEYEAAGVETMVVRFTASNQREQLRRFANVADLR